jgi:hypothetical protein
LVQKQHHVPLSYPDISSFALWETSKQEKGALNNVADMPPSPVVAESGCKLFGISLTDSPSVPNGNKHNLVQSGESDEDPNKGEQSQAMEPEMPRSDATSDQLERLDQNTVESRSHSMRSCTKVTNILHRLTKLCTKQKTVAIVGLPANIPHNIKYMAT